MRNRLVFIFTLAALILLPLAGSAQGQFVRQVPVVGTTVISNSSFATDTGQGPELDPALTGDDENSPRPGPPQKVNRTIAKSTGNQLHSTGHEKRSQPRAFAEHRWAEPLRHAFLERGQSILHGTARPGSLRGQRLRAGDG